MLEDRGSGRIEGYILSIGKTHTLPVGLHALVCIHMHLFCLNYVSSFCPWYIISIQKLFVTFLTVALLVRPAVGRLSVSFHLPLSSVSSVSSIFLYFLLLLLSTGYLAASQYNRIRFFFFFFCHLGQKTRS